LRVSPLLLRIPVVNAANRQLPIEATTIVFSTGLYGEVSKVLRGGLPPPPSLGFLRDRGWGTAPPPSPYSSRGGIAPLHPWINQKKHKEPQKKLVIVGHSRLASPRKVMAKIIMWMRPRPRNRLQAGISTRHPAPRNFIRQAPIGS